MIAGFPDIEIYILMVLYNNIFLLCICSLCVRARSHSRVISIFWNFVQNNVKKFFFSFVPLKYVSDPYFINLLFHLNLRISLCSLFSKVRLVEVRYFFLTYPRTGFDLREKNEVCMRVRRIIKVFVQHIKLIIITLSLLSIKGNQRLKTSMTSLY